MLCLRICGPDGLSLSDSATKGFKWPLVAGSRVKPDHWNPRPDTCAGGLHGIQIGKHGARALLGLHNSNNIWVAFRPIGEWVEIEQEKIKCQEAEVVVSGLRPDVLKTLTEMGFCGLHCSTNTGGDESTNIGGDHSTNIGGISSRNTGGVCSSNTGGDYSSNTGAEHSINTGGEQSTNTGKDASRNMGEGGSTNTGGDHSTNTGKDYSTNTGGTFSKNSGGEFSKNIGGRHSTNRGGKNSINIGDVWAHCSGDEGSTIAIAYPMTQHPYATRVLVGVVGVVGIEPNVIYAVHEGKFVKSPHNEKSW